MSLPPDYIHSVPLIREGLDILRENDPVFSRHSFNLDDFTWPCMGPGFPPLVRIVLGQQVSTKAADSLWRKFSSNVENITPQTILTLGDDSFHNLGVSRQKTSYIKGLATVVEDKSLNLEALNNLPDEVVYDALTALKGFGRWSAEMYLMFGLARPDIWPAGDLGIREGMRRYLDLTERPSSEVVLTEGERFKPYRTAASLLLWQMKSI
ncbi:MAG: DNA-3-methyladenine glycosylase 2 family protein [Rhodospirillales bacterium]|nr:DNA-3-methyladenine glycosylase 2 family protein [Rhodospirillales bacterium]